MKRNINFFNLCIVAFLAITMSACGVGLALPNLAGLQLPSSGNNSSQPAAAAPNAAVSAPVQQPAVKSSAPVSTGILDEEQAFIQIYQAVNPSVVNIRVVMNASAGANSLQNPNGQNPGTPQTPQSPQGPQVPQEAIGSGFVYDTQGHIITNNHVVADAVRIVVTFPDGSQAVAKVIGTDPASDLAVIKVTVDASMLHPVTLGDSDSLKVGQMVAAIGNPFGQESSMSTGIISGLGRLLPTDSTSSSSQSYSIPDIVQTDAAINPGNSGGPLLTMDGSVIGVTTAIDSPVRANSGVGYAVPSAIVKMVVPKLISDGKVEHSYLGISGVAMNADFANSMKLNPNQRGVLVGTLSPGGPAAKAGLRPSSTNVTIDGIDTQVGGDIIVGINDQPIKVFDDLLTYVVRHSQVGEQVTLHILRDGKPMDVTLTMQARPTQ
jgi:serine protease Do